MDTQLKNKTFLVTGASGGIGRATTQEFLNEGANVIVHYHTQKDAAESLVKKASSRALAANADLTNEEQVESLFAQASQRFGQIEGVIVNAGIWNSSFVPIHDMSLAQWQQTLSSDLTSAFLTCRAYLRRLRDQPLDAPSVVLIGSTAAIFGEEGHCDYSAAKAGMAYGLTLSLKNEIARLSANGRVNCICPGWTATPMTQELMSLNLVAKATRTMPLRKVAAAEDIARLAVILSSPALSGHVSGTIIPVSGGMEGRCLHDH